MGSHKTSSNSYGSFIICSRLATFWTDLRSLSVRLQTGANFPSLWTVVVAQKTVVVTVVGFTSFRFEVSPALLTFMGFTLLAYGVLWEPLSRIEPLDWTGSTLFEAKPHSPLDQTIWLSGECGISGSIHLLHRPQDPACYYSGRMFRRWLNLQASVEGLHGRRISMRWEKPRFSWFVVEWWIVSCPSLLSRGNSLLWIWPTNLKDFSKRCLNQIFLYSVLTLVNRNTSKFLLRRSSSVVLLSLVMRNNCIVEIEKKRMGSKKLSYFKEKILEHRFLRYRGDSIMDAKWNSI